MVSRHFVQLGFDAVADRIPILLEQLLLRFLEHCLVRADDIASPSLRSLNISLQDSTIVLNRFATKQYDCPESFHVDEKKTVQSQPIVKIVVQ